MTAYEDALNAGHSVRAHVVAVIDGIPIAFGTSSGRVHPLDTITNAPDAGLTSVEAIVTGSVTLGSTAIDFDHYWVPPAAAGLALLIDQRWLRYFEPRRDPRAVLQTLRNRTDTLFTVPDSSVFADFIGLPLYINRETVRLDTIIDSTTIEVVREYCSLGIDTPAIHQAGSIITTVPQFMDGRVVEIRTYAGEDESAVARRVRLSGSPRINRNRGAIELKFKDAMSFFDRKIVTGDWRGASITGVSIDTSAAVPRLSFAFGADSSDEVINLPIGTSLCFFYGEDGWFIGDVVHLDLSGYPQIALTQAIVTLATDYLSSTIGGAQATSGDDFIEVALRKLLKSVRVVARFTASPMTAFLQLATSDCGDLANGTYDVLPGRSSTATSVNGDLTDSEGERRLGAAVPQSLIDITTLAALDGERSAGFHLIVGVRGSEDLIDIMTEVGSAIGGYFYLNDQQKLSFRKFQAAFATDSISAHFDDTVVLTDTPAVSVMDETEVITSVTLSANYDHITGDYRGQIHAAYLMQQEVYRDTARSLEVKRKSLLVDLPGQSFTSVIGGALITPATLPQIRLNLDRIFKRRANGLLKFSIMVPWRFHMLTPGMRVTLTHDQFYDFAGSTIDGQTFEISSVDTDTERGVLTLGLQECFQGRYIAPTAEVTAWNNVASPPRATLSTTSKWGGGTHPENYFAVGWKVRIFDKSATPPFSVQSTNALTITAMDTVSHNLSLTGTIGFTPASGDLITLAEYDNSSSTVTNAAQVLTPHDYVFLADDSNLLGSANAAANKWA